MNTSGTVSIELRLALEQMRRDLRQATENLKTAFKSKEVGSGIAQASQEMDKLNEKTKKVTQSAKELKKANQDAVLAAWKAGLPAQNISIAGQGSGYGAAGPGAILNQGMATNYNGLGSALPPRTRAQGTGAPPVMFGVPTPPVIPPGNPLNSPLAIAAQLGAAMAGLRVAVGIVKYAFEKLLVPIRMVIAAAEAARRLYANALTSGQSLGFSSRRGLLADAIGVGENEVYRYGEAVKALNARFANAANTFAATAPRLTGLSWDIKMLQADFGALISQLSADLAPAIMTVVRAIDLMVRGMRDHVQMLGRLFKLSMENGMGGFQILYRAMRNLAPESAPSPRSSANRFQASSWERMGLVLGNAPQNYQAQTAANTRQIKEILNRMLEQAPGGTQGALPIPALQ